ncbi:MAG: DUF6886 family protein [Phenylobacterium sp.]
MDRPRLFHVSEEPGIARFVPRPPPSPDSGVTGEAVWAVAESHLVNFLTPRDCPRIGFRAGPATSETDRARFLGDVERVLAIEAAWLARLEAGVVFLYEMPPKTFEVALPEAGYWISRQAVTPRAVRAEPDLVAAIARAGAELRVVEDFWPLADAVAASTLEFSIIRKRNAAPRGPQP